VTSGGTVTSGAAAFPRSSARARLMVLSRLESGRRRRGLRAPTTSPSSVRSAYVTPVNGLVERWNCPIPSAVVRAVPSRYALRNSSSRSPTVKVGEPASQSWRPLTRPPGCFSTTSRPTLPFASCSTSTVTSVLIVPSGAATVSMYRTVPTTMASAARASARSVMATNVVARAPVAIVASAAAMVSVLMVRTSSPECAARRASAVPFVQPGCQEPTGRESERIRALACAGPRRGAGQPRAAA